MNNNLPALKTGATGLFSPEEITEIRKNICPLLSDLEFSLFIKRALIIGANPFNDEIYALVYSPDDPKKRKCTIFVGKNFYLRAAQETGELDGVTSCAVKEGDTFVWDVGGVPVHTFGHKRGKVIGAYAVVWRKGIKHPFVKYLDYDEYSEGKSDWSLAKKNPASMCAKAVQSQTLREAFAGKFAGTYDESEKWEDVKPQTLPVATEPKQTIETSVSPAHPVAEPIIPEKIVETLKTMEKTKSNADLEIWYKSLAIEIQHNPIIMKATNARKAIFLVQEKLPTQDEFVVDDEYISCENELLAELKKVKTEADWDIILQKHLDNATFLKNEGTAKKVNELKATKILK
jgi:phage recombination protein Bet